MFQATRHSARRVVIRYFAHRRIYPWELPSIMRKHIYTGAMGNIWTSLISGLFFIYFGNTIGLSRFQWGLMGGFSAWLIAAQLLSARLTERSGRRKVIWFSFAAADRSLRFVGILLALWLWRAGNPAAGPVLIVTICLANFSGMMAVPPWMSWLADIVPEEEHGAFLGRRSMWIALSVVAVVVPAGYLVDRTPEEHRLATVVALFAAATAVGLADLIIHGTIPEPRMRLPARGRFLGSILTCCRDMRFRPWLVFNGAWTFAMTLGGVLATVYFVENLGLKHNFVGGTLVLTTLTLLGTVFTGRWAGRMVDRHGPHRVLFWAHMGWSLLPLFWMLASPATALVFLAGASLLGGAASRAALNAANKLITRTPSPERRATYAAVSTSVGSLAAGAGAFIGGSILRALGDWHTTWHGMDLEAFHVLFALSFCLRLGVTLVLGPRIPAPPAGASRRALHGDAPHAPDPAPNKETGEPGGSPAGDNG